jgi:exosortase/archaeosortase family protein
MHDGENRLRITVTNKEGPYGIDFAGSLTTPAALAACALVWAALLLALYPQRRRLQSLRIKPLSSRHVRRFWPVSYGVIVVAGLRLNTYSTVSPQDVPLVMLASCTVAMALLLAVLDRQRTQPLPHCWSPGWALASMVLFSLAAYKHIEYTDTMMVFGPILLGVLAATFATTPFFATLHRLRKAPVATSIAFFAAAMSFVYEQCQLLLWQLLVNPTTEAVAALAKLNGWNASTSYGTRLWDDGTVRDYHGYVTTPEFSIQIGSWCGGFEGMTLFLFLLSAFVLLDWQQFARRRRLWLPFLATLPYLFVVNVLRITGVLFYALSIVVADGQDAASDAAIGTFHSHIGWVLYSLAFGPYLWTVYKSAENCR